MKSLWTVYVSFFCGAVSLALGLMLIQDTHKSRMTWYQIEKLLTQKEELEIEYNQLRLEKSMLATGAILDKNIRTHLDMVIPDPTTVVYVNDNKVRTLADISISSISNASQ